MKSLIRIFLTFSFPLLAIYFIKNEMNEIEIDFEQQHQQSTKIIEYL